TPSHLEASIGTTDAEAKTHTRPSSAASAISLSGAAAQLRGVFRSFDFLLNMLSASSSFLSPFQTSCSASGHLPSFGKY
ncbi:unnamed protein product, partial [Musa acuminata var. zebrina]